ncbi:MAG: HAD family hydrolase [Dehalococcoidia bacterium]
MTGARAVIWDMDGVIADTAPLHFEAWREAFQRRGQPFGREDFDRTFGLRNDTIIRTVLGDDVEAAETEAIAREKEEGFRRRLGRGVHPLPGVRDLLAALARHGFGQALASSAPRLNIEAILRTLGMADAFQAIVAEEDVARGKPDPEVFLSAAKKLGLDSARCIVIEDAVAGVRAAGAAGMKSVAVTNTHPRESLAEADLVVDSLVEVNPGILDELVCR